MKHRRGPGMNWGSRFGLVTGVLLALALFSLAGSPNQPVALLEAAQSVAPKAVSQALSSLAPLASPTGVPAATATPIVPTATPCANAATPTPIPTGVIPGPTGSPTGVPASPTATPCAAA